MSVSECDRCRRRDRPVQAAALPYVVPGWLPVGATWKGSAIAGNPPLDTTEPSLRVYSGIWCNRCRHRLAAKYALISLLWTPLVPAGLLAFARDLRGGFRFSSPDGFERFLHERASESGWKVWRLAARLGRSG